jgi:hypothetical protein
MGEISDLIGIYGDIDAAVVSVPERREAVAQILPAYQSPEAVGWFARFEAWTRRRLEEQSQEQSEVEPFLEADPALRHLAEVPAVGRMRARRMLAIAALTRARPEYGVRDSEKGSVAQAALGVDGIAGDVDRGGSLLELLARGGGVEDELFDPDRWWAGVLEEAVARGLLPEGLDKIGPRPCSGRLVRVPLSLPDVGSVEATALKTVFPVRNLTFEKAIRFLDPEVWPGCSDFWCQMKPITPLTNNKRSYHEEVSADCPNKTRTWTITAELDFTFFRSDPDRVAMTEYHLSAGHPVLGDDVYVDDGSLMVEEIATAGAATELRVTTTKRVAFSEAFPGPALAMVMCAVGYASVVEDLVYSCAATTSKRGKPFPEGGAPEKGPAAPGGGTHPHLDPVIKTFTDQVATVTKDCIRELSETAEAAADKISDGQYTSNDLVRDVSKSWVKALREGAAVIDLSVRTAGAVRPEPTEPAEDG